MWMLWTAQNNILFSGNPLSVVELVMQAKNDDMELKAAEVGCHRSASTFGWKLDPLGSWTVCVEIVLWINPPVDVILLCLLIETPASEIGGERIRADLEASDATVVASCT
ncbi:unnamed protein product [Prunus armeniaca]|uniref:Uncharacterized protein n=1 Tax=Prunus armeniaca TaxID=36596 RepID=A0A6J5U0Y1_PRUAR|nr:unnamed protein product [Prunus armeniaca]